MDANWGDMLQLFGSRRPTLYTEIASEVAETGGAETGGRVDQAFRQKLLDADDTTRQSLVVEYIRQELARIMGVEPDSLEVDQPLSTFGLDSLLALELKNNLEGRLDFTLPMAKLMEGPTITSLAQETARLVIEGADNVERPVTLRAKSDEEWTPLFALRPTGTRPVLVLLPALGGDVRYYAEIVQELGDDQPVYAFRPRGIDEDMKPHQSMAEMMIDYVAALRKLQPNGPYRLAGWSTGGIFAFALAEALEQAGQSVAFVALFDAPLPTICENLDPEDDAKFLCDLLNFANCLAGTNVRLDYDQLLTLTPDERFQTALAEARRQGTVPVETPEAYIRRLVHVGEANVRAIQSYEPRLIAGQVHLFVPATKGGLAEISSRELPAVEDNGWTTEIGQSVELHEVPGDHFTMLTGDAAAEIARQLSSLVSIESELKTLRARS